MFQLDCTYEQKVLVLVGDWSKKDKYVIFDGEKAGLKSNLSVLLIWTFFAVGHQRMNKLQSSFISASESLSGCG